MTQVPSAPERRLLTGGETLRTELEYVNTGGGEKYEPMTAAEAREALLPRLENALETADALPAEQRAPGRLYIEAQLLPNFISASDFPEALLTRVGAVPVGSRFATGTYQTKQRARGDAATRRLVLSIEDAGLAELLNIVAAAGGETRSDRAAFEEIRKLSDVGFAPAEEVIVQPLAGVDDADPMLCEAVLHPATTVNGEPVPLDEVTLERWFAFIEARGEVVRDYVRTVGGLTFSPIYIRPRDAETVASFNPLRALRPMPAIRPRPTFGTRWTRRLTPPTSPAPIAPAPQVAVFDGGVDVDAGNPSPYFPIVAADLTPEAPDQEDLDHGTGVTGATLFGLVASGDVAPPIPLPTESFRVLPAPNIPHDLNGYWVLDQIRDVIERGDHKIVNLSLGPEIAVEDSSEPSRWTSELDQLAWEYDALFIVASGNNGHYPEHTGLHRVQVPADMVNGLGVGATDTAAPHTPWKRAGYSSMGPGRAGCRVQPVGVQFGGDYDTQMFQVLRADGTFLEASGTSFAAPVHTHALAELTTLLPKANPSILRSFSAHFAERPSSRHHKLRPEVGHGRFPLTFTDVLDASPDEVHVLYADEISRGEIVGYRLPVPTSSQTDLELRITLAYASPVEPTQPTEYTQASIEMVLRPHDQMYSYSPPKELRPAAKSETHLLTSPDAATLRVQGWKESQEPVSKSLGTLPGMPELDLREAGKWETLRHYRINLNATAVRNPRLDISYLARRTGSLDPSAADVPFAILVTVIDPSQGGKLYDDAVAQFSALRAVPRVASRVRVRAGSRHGNWG